MDVVGAENALPPKACPLRNALGRDVLWIRMKLQAAKSHLWQRPRRHEPNGPRGAPLGRPDRPTWVVAGDGGFQMTCQELATVVQERVPLRIAVVNNGFLGMVRQWQELFYERRYAASELPGPDLVALAGAYGIPGRAIDRAEDLDAALEWAERQDGPVLLDMRVPREENVYPMVPAGAALDELVLPPAGGVAVA
jgi:acetolactate synthase I/II/III large subunit